MDRPAKISRERTTCPACARPTRTTSDGVCVECWCPKRADARPIHLRGPRTERLGEGGSWHDGLELDLLSLWF